jgi:hypothetical protein
VAQIGNVPLRAEDEVKFKGRRRARAHEGKEERRPREGGILFFFLSWVWRVGGRK